MRLYVLFASAAALILAGSCSPTYPKCDKDEHCSDNGEVCVENLCQQCRDKDQCQEGEVCQGGRCETKVECVEDSDCSGQLVCRVGQCKEECASDGDCGSGMNCKSGRCVDPLACSGEGQCGSNQSCIAGRCTENVSSDRELPCTFPTIRFAFNEATLAQETKQGLQEIVECLNSKPGTLTIEGHCDERGTEEYNLALGDRRARAVRDYLERLGVSTSRLRVLSKGETQPLDPGHNEAAWDANRRAEFIEE